MKAPNKPKLFNLEKQQSLLHTVSELQKEIKRLKLIEENHKKTSKVIDKAIGFWESDSTQKKNPQFMGNPIVNQKVAQALRNLKNGDNVDLFL